MKIIGIVKKDKKTKNLIHRLNNGDIALVQHKDIDEIAALSLIEANVKCVINTEKSISGKYPNLGPLHLINNGIPIFQTSKEIFNTIKDNSKIKIIKNSLFMDGKFIAKCELLDRNKINRLLKIASNNLENELDNFIENTLAYAKKEKDLVLGNIKIPKIKTNIKNKHVLIVIRGKDYKKDLITIQNYINEIKPVLIGVDGGGDTLLEFGYIPDIVIGDMDSISDKCLKIANEIVVHAYPDGRSPGYERVSKLGLNSIVFNSPGTSEDIALLLAYCNDADLIVAVGSHSNMIDFLEKGRKGMASTFLVRLKVGSKLIDAKGVNKLYKSNLKLKYLFSIWAAALIPIFITLVTASPMKDIIRLINIKLKLLLGI
ncbi:putative cytokinetic ring protein SteA [Caldisalinibacter kiritimatiensis]|uniref:Putativ membrane protein n=1 Tax=Caldisalinibacter kiritimatiensis TaxID=1304284 RepID=R1AV11_9FIRM|nr:putative cytokinetic ring protein SteA [Caldisalinibacter kiritimatiensis]EOD00467.1 putativ membrane protein [Caldisalinibacter kiritimatiensis]